MIFNSTDQIKEVFGGPNLNNEFGTMRPYLDAALDDVLPYLSVTMWEKLVTDFEGNSEDEDHLALLKVVRTALAHFAYLRFAEDGTMQISDMGFHRVETGDEKSAYNWMLIKFTDARSRDGWAALNRMLLLLDSKKGEAYSEWGSSDEYEFIRSFFLWNTTEFSKHRSLADLRTLHAMRNSMMHVQDEIIARNIGKDLYAELKEELLDDNFSSDNRALLPMLNKCIAHLSTARAIDEGLLKTSERGLVVKTVLSSEGENETADLKRIEMMRADAEKKGNAALKDLREFLNTNASETKYPSYFADEDLYDDPTDTTDQTTFKNADGGTFFAR